VYIYPLKYVSVTVLGCDCVALEDSGCQIPLVSNRLFLWCCNETVGNVTLHGFGKDQTVCAPLVNLNVCLNDAEPENVRKIPIVCAVTDLHSPDYDVILPVDVVRDLQVAAGAVSVSGCVATDVCDVNTETDAPEVEVNTQEDVDSLPTNHFYSAAESSILAQEQEQDPTLAPCWVQAQAGKGGFVVHKDLLYHQDQVDGQPVSQLCVPQGRRAQILRFCGHLGERKTRERIMLSFYWPGLRKSVLTHVQSCYDCQLRSRPVTADQVPIMPITRADVPFQVMNMDCICPLDPTSAQGHRYCLCAIDNCTRWPSVYMLKSL